MALQQYLFAKTERDETELLYYFREHPDLECFMANLYYSKGREEEFNLVHLPLSSEDIDVLEAAFNIQVLYKWTEDIIQTWNFIHFARDALTKNKTIYYTSWW